MMNENQIILTSKLNEHQKAEAAKLLYKSFPLKFTYNWIYNENEEQAFKLLKEGLNYNYGIYAVFNGKVIGLLGLDCGKGKRFMDFSLRVLMKTFNFFGGLWRYLKYSFEKVFIHTKANSHQSRIHPIAVSPDARGKGVGSLLLIAFEKYSKKIGNKSVVLEVVDTNPLAKKLYEREGYITYKYLDTSLFSKKTGFNGLYFMRKSLV